MSEAIRTSDEAAIQTVETQHGEIAYRVDGSVQPDRPPLVLLQRFRGTMDDWDPAFVAALAARRPVIRFDSAGVGRSKGTAPDSCAAMAAVAADVLSALKLETADVLGWSMGGNVAQELALLKPKLVRRLVVAGSSCGGLTEGPKADPRVAPIAGKGVNDDADFLFLFFAPTPTSQAAGMAHLERLHAASTGSPLVSGPAVQAQATAIKTWPGVRDRLGRLTVPTLVANGLHDVMVLSYGSYVLAHEAPDARLVLYPDAGHGFLFQDVGLFTGEVDRFLSA